MSGAHDIEERAARWVLKREEPGWSPADAEELASWLAESDAHKAAFWRLEHGWRQADRIAATGASLQPSRPRFEPKPWWSALAVAAALALAFGVFMLHGAQLPFASEAPVRTVRFETAVGGHKMVELPDGSRVELNTNTVIRAAVGGARRTIWLDRGEAYFNVTRRGAREFVIYAGPRAISVLGTRFSVRRGDRELVVAVVEGRVLLKEAESSGRAPTTVTSGEIAIATDRNTIVAANSAERVQEQLAWRTGRLLFDGTTLAEAAAEFNRYNTRRLVIRDPAAARVRIGGSFDARNVEGFARLLERAYRMNVEIGNEKIEISS